MAGTILEQPGTFADDIGISPAEDITEDFAEIEDEGEEEDFCDVTRELNPPLDEAPDPSAVNFVAEVDSRQLVKLEDAVVVLSQNYNDFIEGIRGVSSAVKITAGGVKALNKELVAIKERIRKQAAALESLIDTVQDWAAKVEAKALDRQKPKKKGTPGRPVRQTPKLTAPKGKKKSSPKKMVRAKPKVIRRKAKR